MKQKKIIPFVVSVVVVLCMSLLNFFNAPLFVKWIDAVDNWSYDLTIRLYHKPMTDHSHVTILDIDDRSLEEIGRWPWTRKILSEITRKLYELGATVIGFDLICSEPEANIVDLLIQDISSSNPSLADQLKTLKPSFDYDALFASSLQKGEATLAMAFSKDADRKSVGELPPPLLVLPKELRELDIPMMHSYLSNISILEKAAKNGGFVNAEPDVDGIIRRTPLIYRYEDKIYSSLALAATGLYLIADQIKLMTSSYGGEAVLQGINIDQFLIPTDPQGKILIPYRGKSYSFPYVSAIDLLQNRVPREKISNKLVFIGFSATGLGDLKTTSIDPVFPGVEIHASIAQGILEKYLPLQPAWSKGLLIILTLLFGIVFSLLAARFGALVMSVFAILYTAGAIGLKVWLFTAYQLVIPIFFSILVLLIIYFFNLIYGYLVESQAKKDIKSTFGQYVAPEYIDILLEHPDTTFNGVTKELSVIFGDIRNFTNISEKFSAPELKQFLNLYFNPMTDIIFKRHGTIDKYVGDMIMAFWGAPIENPRHAYDAISTALAMWDHLHELNAKNKVNHLPEIYTRIGINTGLMNVGDMGSAYRKSYTVLGDAVNLASRLEGIAKYYYVNILVGEDSYKQTSNDFLFRKIDKVKVKGKNNAIDIFLPICHIEKASAKDRELASRHAQALELYQKQKWDESEKLFIELQKDNPEHKELYGVFLQRIKDFRKLPPLADWGGVHILETK